MKTNAQNFKADVGKPNPLLLETGCPRALLAAIYVLDFGALKYEPHGWQDLDMELYNAAARRHRLARDLGEERDPESGLLHLAHEAVNLLFQLEMKCRETDVGFVGFSQPFTDHQE